MVKNMMYIYSWLTKRKVTSTAHWGKVLPRQQKQQKSIKKVAITQGKIRYKKREECKEQTVLFTQLHAKKIHLR
jgi:hypothetical protein